jgi:hypothetical protein
MRTVNVVNDFQHFGTTSPHRSNPNIERLQTKGVINANLNKLCCENLLVRYHPLDWIPHKPAISWFGKYKWKK